MAKSDYFSDQMKRKEQAEEDLYFARRDRELIEALHRDEDQDEGREGGGAGPPEGDAGP